MSDSLEQDSTLLMALFAPYGFLPYMRQFSWIETQYWACECCKSCYRCYCLL